MIFLLAKSLEAKRKSNTCALNSNIDGV
jgi:hypothetical protein